MTTETQTTPLISTGIVYAIDEATPNLQAGDMRIVAPDPEHLIETTRYGNRSMYSYTSAEVYTGSEWLEYTGYIFSKDLRYWRKDGLGYVAQRQAMFITMLSSLKGKTFEYRNNQYFESRNNQYSEVYAAPDEELIKALNRLADICFPRN